MSAPQNEVAHNEVDDDKNDNLQLQTLTLDVEDGEVKIDTLVADETFTESEFKILKRKVDWMILPLMWWCYGIQQTDKSGLSTMAIYGLTTSVPMTTHQYSLLTVIFYAAYALCEFPFAVVLQRFALGRTLSIFMFLWGVVLLGQAFAENWATMIALRFLQGALECTITPGFGFLIATWYTTREHNAKFLFFASANAGWSIVTSLVMYGIGVRATEVVSALAPWRIIAIFLAGQTIICSVLCFFILGSPDEVRWLNHREKIMANARILKNHAGSAETGKKRFDMAQVKEAFLDPVTYFLLVNAFLSSICNGAIGTFGGLITVSFGFTNIQVTLYAIPGFVVSMVWFGIIGIMTSKYPGYRLYSMIVSVIPPFIALLSISLLPDDVNLRWTKWGLYLMLYTFTVPFFGSIALIASNCIGKTKRSVVVTVCLLGYTMGNIAGSQVMTDAPRYVRGTIIVSVCLAIEVVDLIVWRLWLSHQNRSRAKKVLAMDITPEEEELRARKMAADDTTDGKNLYFRYDL